MPAGSSMQRGDAVAKLTTKERDDLPKRSFAIPSERAYPVNDAHHARLALAMVARYGSPDQQTEVRTAVKKRFPDIV